jgi:hypothetical protein
VGALRETKDVVACSFRLNRGEHVIMPSPEAILNGLSSIANQWWLLAAAWHAYFAVLVVGLILGARPSKRIGGILLALPLLSVSALAWTAANPFNGLLLGAAGLALIVLALRLPPEPVEIAAPWLVVAGAMMFVFGWVYPHFLDTFPPFAYLYAAPTGLVPCPTLSIVIGLALMVGGLDSRLWTSVLAVTGLFYGVFGALRLGVTIDVVLLLGALLALVAAFLPKAHAPRHAAAH